MVKIWGCHWQLFSVPYGHIWYPSVTRAIGTGQASQAMAWPVLAAQVLKKINSYRATTDQLKSAISQSSWSFL